MFIVEKSTYMWLFHLVFTGTQLKLLSEPFLKKVRQRGGKYYQGHGWLFKEIWGLQCICHTCHCITKPRIPYSSSRYQVPPSLHQTKYTQVYRCLQGHRFEAPSRPAKKKSPSLSLRKQETFRNTTTGFRNFQWNNIWGKSAGNSILMIYYYSDLGSASDPSYREGNLPQWIKSTT